jgi:hypothetical protein
MSKNISNQQTERNKLINRMKTAPIPKLPHPFIMYVPKKSLDRRSGMPQRTDIKIKIKIPKRTKLAHIHTQTAYQLPKEGERESERARERDSERARERDSERARERDSERATARERQRESDSERATEREKDLSFSETATKRTPHRIKFAGPQTKNEAHLSPFLVETSRRAMPNKDGE